jgi:hypothetical protein
MEERQFESYEQPDSEWVWVVKKKDCREKPRMIVDHTPIKKWEHVKRDLRPQQKKDIEHDESYDLFMKVEDINIYDIEIHHGVEYDQQRKIGLKDQVVTYQVEIDGKSQEWKFHGAAEQQQTTTMTERMLLLTQQQWCTKM